MSAAYRCAVGEKFLHEVSGLRLSPRFQPCKERALRLQVNGQTSLPFRIEEIVVSSGRFFLFDELVIVRDGRKPQTVGMKIALSIMVLRLIELRLRRMVARPDAGPLQCHDIFSADGNDVRI